MLKTSSFRFRSLVLSNVVLFFSAIPVSFAGGANVDERIAQAQRKVKESTASYQSFNDLASALCVKARDTEDPSLYDRAARALDQSLRLSAGNYEARKLNVVVLIGKGDYSRALLLAKELNRKVPDDIAGWALLVDANVGLGEYAEAERDAQWILDLRPGNPLGFEKAALLRELFGDVPGAVEFLDEANRRTSMSDSDGHTWLLLQKARLQSAAGYQKQAWESLVQARKLSPESVLALKVEAQIRMSEGMAAEAATILEKTYALHPSGRTLYALAEALSASGQESQANAAFKRFASESLANIGTPSNSDVQLVLYKLDREMDRPGALALASRIGSERHDCATLDALAWALNRNGRYAEAKAQIERALAVGVRNPGYYCHAVQIAVDSGDAASAEKYKKELATFAGASCPVEASSRPMAQAGR